MKSTVKEEREENCGQALEKAQQGEQRQRPEDAQKKEQMNPEEVQQRERRERLEEAVRNWIGAHEEEVPVSLDDLLWEALEAYQGYCFRTAKNLAFTYRLRGFEMFVDRKDKSITRATVMLSFHRALRLQCEIGAVTGPKKLGTFGASYLYPVFLELNIICTGKQMSLPL